MASNGKPRNRTGRHTPLSSVRPAYLALAGVVVLIIVAIGIYDGISHRSVAPRTAPTHAPGDSQATPPAFPYTTRHIYSETADPHAEIAAALKQAQAEHKRVLLDFGGDWCGDCQVLDIYFHQPPNDALLNQGFILTHVWIGRMDHNVDIAEKYGVPLKKGVPALAVLDASGKVLYSQQTGEFENMRHMDAASVTSFLDRWKA